MSDVVWVCRTCGRELVRVEMCDVDGDDRQLHVAYVCEEHGEVAFVLGGIAA